jgi:glycosyltransferase involved in cell wall biosynthesis
MKKLLIITPGFPRQENESHIMPYIQNVILSFKNLYPSVHLTILSTHKPISKTSYQWHGIEVIPLNGNDVKYPTKIGFLIKSYFKLKQLIQKNKYDGIFNLWYNEFTILTQLIKCNRYTWMLGQDVKPDNFYLKILKPKPERILAMSPSNNDILFQTNGVRAHKVIPIAINEALFPLLNTGERAIDLFGAGNLSALKNYKLFIQVIIELKKTNPFIKAELAGDGPEEQDLKTIIAQNNLQNNITLLGLISNAEVLNKMNNAKIFLHTSTFEGGSTVYVEALYSGCQLVGTLPLLDKEIENFHCHKTVADIGTKINYLLANPKPAKRIIYYSMEMVCNEIYSLFYH